MSKGILQKCDKIDLELLKENVIKSKLETSVKCDFINYINSSKSDAIKNLRQLVYSFFKAERAIKVSRDCSELSMWVHKVAENLDPSVVKYSNKQIDLVIALLIYEQTMRDESYNDILCRFTEVYKSEGGGYFNV